MNSHNSGRSDLRIQLLGPVRVRRGVHEVDLGSTQQKGLLSLLALAAGQQVSRYRLSRALWGPSPPSSWANALQVYVARLRRVLEPDRPSRAASRLLPSIGDGYALMVEPDTVDALRFRRLLHRAAVAHRRGDHGEVCELLRPALDAWQHPLSGAGFFDDQAMITALTDERWTAVVLHAGAALAGGRAAEALTELQEAAAARPLDEHIQALLIHALRAVGRRADGVNVYCQVRQALREALGVDPGAELAGAYAALIETDPGGVDLGHGAVDGIRPAQLPARAGHFTGRAGTLSTLHRVLSAPADRMRVVCVEGTAGIGKTALATELAYGLSSRFDEGQMFVDLRGHDAATAVHPGDALLHLLRSLGIDGTRLPSDPAELAAHYRTVTAGRRLLVVLDNAATTEQVAPLLPATPSCAVIVTSRRHLAALATHHVTHRQTVDVLTEGEAMSLLAGVLGNDRVNAEPDVAADLTRLCGRLPLALRVAAAKAAADPRRPLAALVSELTDERDRLSGLAVEEGTISVRGAFASSYRSLSTPEARMFRLLSLHPGTTFTADLAAAITNHTWQSAREILTRLWTAHLITAIGSDRYSFHDLIRLCATDVLTTDEPQTGRDAAAERLLDWYLTIAHGCCRLVNPRHDGVPPPAHPSSPPFRAEPGAALDYLTNEADNLPPVVRYAVARGSTTTAWRLAYLLFPFYLSRTRPADFLECARLGLQAAEHAGDRRARALMLNVAGVAANVAHRMADSTDLHREQIVSWQELGEPVREAGAWNNLGIAHAWLNQHGDALAAYQHALALADAAGDLVLAAIALDNIGDAARDLGDLDLSEQSLNRALETWRVLANLQGQGQALLGLARTAHFRSDNDTAMRCLTQAIELQRYVGDERMAALTLHWTGKARLDQGQTLAAKEDLQRAHALCRDMNDEHGESAVLTTLAAAYLQLDDFGAAHDCLLQAQTLRSHVPDPLEHGRLHYYISDLATRLGDSQRAITHLDQAIASLTGAGCIEARRLLQLITVAQNQDQGR